VEAACVYCSSAWWQALWWLDFLPGREWAVRGCHETGGASVLLPLTVASYPSSCSFAARRCMRLSMRMNLTAAMSLSLACVLSYLSSMRGYRARFSCASATLFYIMATCMALDAWHCGIERALQHGVHLR